MSSPTAPRPAVEEGQTAAGGTGVPAAASGGVGPRVSPRIGAAALERARLRIVPRTRRRPATRVPFVGLVTIVLLGGVVGLLLFNTSMQQASFATTALEGQATNLAARQQTLQAELDELRAPQAVAERARDLGMVVPSTPAFLDLRTGEVTGGRPATATEDQLRLMPRPPPKPAALERPSRQPIDVPADGSPDRPAGDGSAAPGAGSAERRGANPSLGGPVDEPGGAAAQEDRP